MVICFWHRRHGSITGLGFRQSQLHIVKPYRESILQTLGHMNFVDYKVEVTASPTSTNQITDAKSSTASHRLLSRKVNDWILDIYQSPEKRCAVASSYCNDKFSDIFLNKMIRQAERTAEREMLEGNLAPNIVDYGAGDIQPEKGLKGHVHNCEEHG